MTKLELLASKIYDSSEIDEIIISLNENHRLIDLELREDGQCGSPRVSVNHNHIDIGKLKGHLLCELVDSKEILTAEISNLMKELNND